MSVSVKALIAVGMTSLLASTLVALPAPARAWQPKGVIVKKVQNVTSNSVLSDADEEAQAIVARPGDTLKYVIEISNEAEDAGANGNDLTGVHLEDTLPVGVELTTDAAKRTILEDLGTIKPKQKITKEYTVKVTATQNGTLIDNKACFKGDSAAGDSAQDDCNHAKVKVTVPAETPKPTTPAPTKPAETPKQETPAKVEDKSKLPQTGAEVGLSALLGSSVLGYAGHAYVRSKHGLARALRLKK